MRLSAGSAPTASRTCARRCAWLYRWLSHESLAAAMTSSGRKRMSLPISSDTPSTVTNRTSPSLSVMTCRKSRPWLCRALMMSTRLRNATSGSQVFSNVSISRCSGSSSMPSACNSSSSSRAMSKSCNPARIRSSTPNLCVEPMVPIVAACSWKEQQPRATRSPKYHLLAAGSIAEIQSSTEFSFQPCIYHHDGVVLGSERGKSVSLP